ncbi:hypothetical protein [Leptothoe kymatousa]|nr:hypothetical protein [Leptothoe kymatousa]
MKHYNRAIVPTDKAPVVRRQGSWDNFPATYPGKIIVHQHIHQAPVQPERPSHYSPKPMADSGLGEVAKWGAGCLVALLCTWLVGNAIIHQANSNYWTNERQLQIIRNHPTGGQW